MDGGDRFRRRRSLQEHLGLVCRGPTWGIKPASTNIGDVPVDQLSDVIGESNTDPACPRMNLAAALAAERESRPTAVAADDGGSFSLPSENMLSCGNKPPARISLMKLLEETTEEEGVGMDLVCCVCMGRKKGAAFIPCGHTFCRVCSRELWLNRGSCPLCNRSILEILDIF